MRRALPLLLCSLLATGCGFQLRGGYELPAQLSSTRVITPDPYSPLVTELSRQLESSGAGLAGADDATATLRILDDQLQRQVQSVGGSARVREFALEYLVRFQLEDADGELLQAPRTVRLRRDYAFDQRQVLGTTAEEEILIRDLRREMAAQIVRRLAR